MTEHAAITITPGVTLTVLDRFAADHAERFAAVFRETWRAIPDADRRAILAAAGERGLGAEFALFSNRETFDAAHADPAAHCLRFSVFVTQYLCDDLLAMLIGHEAGHLLDFGTRRRITTDVASFAEYRVRKIADEAAAIANCRRWGLEPFPANVRENRQLNAWLAVVMPALEPVEAEAAPPQEPTKIERELKALPPVPSHAPWQRFHQLHPRVYEYWTLSFEQWRAQRATAAA